MQSASRLHITASSLSGDSKNAHHSPALKILMRSFTSMQMFHTHTHPARRGFFRKNVKLSKRSEAKTDTARYVHMGQAAVLSSRRKIAG